MSVEPVHRKGGRRWRVRYRDETNRPRTETYDLKAHALARDGEVRHAKQLGQPLRSVRVRAGETFDDLAAEWIIKDAKARGLAPKTLDGYGWMLDKHLSPRVGGDAVARIDVERVIELRAQLAADGVPDYTRARALKLFRQIMGYAVTTARIAANPADYLRGRGQLPTQRRTSDIRPLGPETVEQIRAKLLARSTPHACRDATLVSVLAYAGLRPGEALALTWDNVREDALRVEHANRDGVIGPTKTGQRRTVRLVERALHEDIETWRAVQPAPPASADLVFPRSDGGAWTREDYNNWRSRVWRPNAPSGARPYDLRHGHASLLVRAHWGLAEVARRLGHSPAMTAQHYTHVFEEFEGQAAQSVADSVAAARQAEVSV